MPNRRLQDFLYRFYKPITVFVTTLLGILGTFIASKYGSLNLKDYVAGVSGGLALSVLLWLWKFENDSKDSLGELAKRLESDLKKTEERLESDIKKTDDRLNKSTDLLERDIQATDRRIASLWVAFRKLLGDEKFENILRDIIVHYTERTGRDRDKKMAEKALRDLQLTSQVLSEREYKVYFDAVTSYPEPFYKEATRVRATNVVPRNKFWSDQMTVSLLELNRDVIERRRARLNNPQAEVVSRVFVFEEKLSKLDFAAFEEIMKQQKDIGVCVRYIGKDRARNVVKDTRDTIGWKVVQGIEDFTLFDTETEDLRYAGRFKTLDGDEKAILITSNPSTTGELEQQFEALWRAAAPFDEHIAFSGKAEA